MAFGPGDLPAGPLTKGLKSVFMQAYNEASQASLINRICTVVKSDSASEDYPWLGAVPSVREFVGEREAKDLANFNFNITNKEWENTLGIKRTDIDNQKFGMVTLQIQQLAQEAANYKERLVLEFLSGALTTQAAPYLCYDGQGLFDNDHPPPNSPAAGTQDNLGGTALAAASLWAGIAAMRSFTNDVGRPIGCVPDLLLVEPCLEQTAKELLTPWGSGLGGSAATAVLANYGIDVVVCPSLYTTGTVANGNWILMDTKRVVKPLIFQERTPIEFTALERESDSGFWRNQYVYGTYASYNVGAGAWFACYGNIGAG